MMNEIRLACFVVAAILAALSAIPPMPAAGSLRGAAIAFIAAGLFMGG